MRPAWTRANRLRYCWAGHGFATNTAGCSDTRAVSKDATWSHHILEEAIEGEGGQAISLLSLPHRLPLAGQSLRHETASLTFQRVSPGPALATREHCRGTGVFHLVAAVAVALTPWDQVARQRPEGQAR